MSYKSKSCGFSLAETLIAMGVLAVGMVFVAGVFPVGIYFTNVSIDRTVAATVADEAFAMVRLYAAHAHDANQIRGLETDRLRDFNDWFAEQGGAFELTDKDFAYPSDPNIELGRKQYCWSALCRLIPPDPNVPADSRLVQVTVLVSRRAGPSTRYYAPDCGSFPREDEYGRLRWPNPDLADWPRPVKIEVTDLDLEKNELRIVVPPQDRQQEEKWLINDGHRIVADNTGAIYRVLERYPDDDDDIILLDRDWEDNSDYVWVVPPVRAGGASPHVAIYQKIIRF